MGKPWENYWQNHGKIYSEIFMAPKTMGKPWVLIIGQ
jgi:hypothetical protein